MHFSYHVLTLYLFKPISQIGSSGLLPAGWGRRVDCVLEREWSINISYELIKRNGSRRKLC